ncbi:MAG: phenylalanine--tRNA ligase subunit beta, partial [Comamonadaceae bacterium]
AGPMDDQVLLLPERKPVSLRVARAARVIGMPITQAQCADALARLGLETSAGEGVLTVVPPSHRFDLAIEEDLIEEVVRILGYNNLPTSPPLAPITAKLPPESRRSRFAMRRLLAALGYQETINFSFVEESWERDLAGNTDPIRLLNPIASQMNVMRSSLVGSLLQALRFNLDRKAERVRLFELGRVFMRDASVATTDTTVRGIRQPIRVAGLVYGDSEGLQWARQGGGADFFDAKGDVEALLSPRKAVFTPAQHPAMHPGRCAAVWLDGREAGFVGELHPRWRQNWELKQAPMLFELDLDAVIKREVAVFTPVPRFQPVERDFAVIVADSVSHAALMQAVHSAATAGLLRDAVLFDVYKPGVGAVGLTTGEKSLAVRLTLGSPDATLTDDQIEAAVKAVVDNVTAQLGGRLRA